MDTDETNVHDDVRSHPRQQRKQCHGNRKDQRFRNKCRARGMKSAKIKKLLEKRKQVNHGQNRINAHARDTRGAETNTIAPNTDLTVETIVQSVPTASTVPANTHKRKRDESSQSQTGSNPPIPKSISSISMAQPTSKKTKPPMIRMPLVTMNDGRINKNYRLVFLLIE